MTKKKVCNSELYVKTSKLNIFVNYILNIEAKLSALLDSFQPSLIFVGKVIHTLGVEHMEQWNFTRTNTLAYICHISDKEHYNFKVMC
jgi:hypothetical protein